MKKLTMKNNHVMTRAQKEDLLIEWNLYDTYQQKTILSDFHKNHNEDYTNNDFLQFLRRKLDMDGYWKKSGIS